MRLLAGDHFKLKKPKAKYGIDPDFVPSQEGLDTLCVSASAQFSVPQFRTLAESIRSCAGDRTVYIVDLRQESHGFVNEGVPLSWYGVHNWQNDGMDLSEIEEDEAARFADLVGQTIKTYDRDGDEAIDEADITVESFLTEKELVGSEGFEYLHLPLKDHNWPSAEKIDEFIRFYRSIDPGKSWLHFHCYAGKGRTGIMMVIYDMMRNPNVPMEDIAVRQTLLGATYPLYTEDSDDYKSPLYAEKAAMTPLFYAYVQENSASNYEVPWSQWLEARNALNDAA